MLFNKRRCIALFLACACSIAALTGCGSIAGGNNNNKSSAESSENEKKVIMARGIDSSTIDSAMASKNQDV